MPCDRACLWPTYLHAEGRRGTPSRARVPRESQGLAPHVWNDHVGQRYRIIQFVAMFRIPMTRQKRQKLFPRVRIFVFRSQHDRTDVFLT